MVEFADVAPAVAAVAPEPNASLQMQANGVGCTDQEILQRYEQERLKRLRDDGNAQYIDPSLHPKLRRFQQDIWAEGLPNPGLDKAQNGDKYKVVLLGAGFGALSTAARLKQAGIDNIAILDIAGGFGGTWYWNRYPGLMCDVESYIYMPLLEETGYIPKHKYSSGLELRLYADLLADHFELRDKAIFRVKVDTVRWDDEKNHYTINLTRLDGKGNLQILADIVITNCGAINLPKMPDLPGMLDFAGRSFHTSRWDYSYTGGTQEKPDMIKLQDKRVGIIGTGATAIQAVPQLGKWAKELYVFQRTPSSVDVRNNHATDPEWFKNEVAGSGPGWQRRRQENFNLHVADIDLEVDLVSDAWTAMRTFSYIVGTPKINKMKDIPSYLAEAQARDLPRQERIRERVEDIVKDKATAEKLKPWYSGWCKRPCFHDEYLPTFNRPNVHLVDTDGKGVDKVTENGVVVAGKEYPVDVLIFGTGYWIKGGDSPAAKANFKAFGKGGVSMDDKWAEKITTLHGLIMDGFPNYFFPGPNQAGAAANMVYGMTTFADHITYILTEAYKKSAGGRVLIEGIPNDMEDWAQQITSRAGAFAALGGCTPSYLNGEGAIAKPLPPEVAAKAVRAALWGEGVQSYIDILSKWRADGDLKGLKVTTLATEA